MALRDPDAQWVLHYDFDKHGGAWIQAVELRTPARSAVHRLEHPLPARPGLLPGVDSPRERRAELLTAEAKLAVLPEPVRMAFTLAEAADDAVKAESPREAGGAIAGKALEVIALAMFQTVDLAGIAPLVKAVNDEFSAKTAIVDPGTLQELADEMDGPHRTAAQKLLDGVAKLIGDLREPESPPPPIPEEPEPELEEPEEPMALDDPETPPPPEPEKPEPPPPRPPEPPEPDFGWL